MYSSSKHRCYSLIDGVIDGSLLGTELGAEDGMLLGAEDGMPLGILDIDGSELGAEDGMLLGAEDGMPLGILDKDGSELGDKDGIALGSELGDEDGTLLGILDIDGSMLGALVAQKAFSKGKGIPVEEPLPLPLPLPLPDLEPFEFLPVGLLLIEGAADGTSLKPSQYDSRATHRGDPARHDGAQASKSSNAREPPFPLEPLRLLLDPFPLRLLLDPFPLPFPLVGGELIDGGLDVEGAADGVAVPKRPRQHSMHWQSLGSFIISIMEELLEEPFPFPLPLPMHIVML